MDKISVLLVFPTFVAGYLLKDVDPAERHMQMEW